MGLITGLLTLPLAPIRGVVWVAEQVENAAERQFYDRTPIEEALKALELELVTGQITEEEFDLRESELLDELEEIQRFWAAKRA